MISRCALCLAKTVRSRLFAGIGFALLFSVVALGQAQNTGTLTGNVKDATGAVVPNATLTLTSTAQGRSVTVKSNAKGEYLFSDVAIGLYQLHVEASTFASSQITNIAVDADQNIRLDVTLEPESAKDIVEVQAGSVSVDTRSATIGTMVDRTLVENLPIDGNNIVALTALLPGVTDVNAPTTFTSDTGGPTFIVSGSRSNQNLFLFDGAVWNNQYSNSGLNYPPPFAHQEVSVLLNNYKAQYGRSVGAIMNVLTRSGTNTIHGDIWEFIQNQALNAKDYMTGLNPKLVQNQFGATIGGPMKRNKMFYFLSYQGLRIAQQTTAADSVLTPNEWGLQNYSDGANYADGNNVVGGPRPCVSSQFAGYNCASFAEDDPAAVSTALHNPLTYSTTNSGLAITALNTAYTVAGGTGSSPCISLLSSLGTAKYLPNAEIPQPCWNPVTTNLFTSGYIPLPNHQLASATLPVADSLAPRPQTEEQGLARIDWNLGRHTIDARFYITRTNDQTSNSVNNGAGIATYDISANSAGIYFGNIGDTWVVMPSLLNVARLSYKRYNYIIQPMDPTTLATLGASIFIPGVPTLPQVNVNSRFDIGNGSSTYSDTINEDIEFDDNLSWVVGNHNLQFGLQFLDLQYLHRYDTIASVSFNNNYTNDPAADFMFGFLSNSSFGNSVNQGAIQHPLYLYAQDDWRIASRLTLNLGLRYELPFQWYEPDGEAATFIPGYQSSIYPSAPPNLAFVGDPGIGKALYRNDYSNLAPRFGLAYDLSGNGSTSIRAGFGIFYDNTNAQIVGVSEPYHYAASYTSGNPGGLSEPLLGLTQIPANYVRGQAPVFNTPYSITFADANFHTPYVMAFNFGFQEHLGRSSTLEMNYVGRIGRHQAAGFDLNPAIYDCTGSYFLANPSVYCTNAGGTQASYNQRVKYPGFNAGGGGVLDYISEGNSSYNGMQAIYTRRVAKNLNVVASYTYSKSLDDYSGIAITNTFPEPTIADNYAPSDFDSRQVFNIGWHWMAPNIKGGWLLTRTVFSNWTIGGVYNARTGHPFNINSASDTSLRDERPERLNQIGNLNLPSNRHRVAKIAEWFDTASVALPTTGTYGNMGRNALYGPAYINLNLAFGRIFPLPGTGKRLQFRADAINALNEVNLSNPQVNYSNVTTKASNFGQIISDVGANGTVGTTGRRWQFALILHY